MAAVVEAAAAATRVGVYKQMPEALRKVADALIALEGKAALTDVQSKYRIGETVSRVGKAPAQYGEGAVQQLADYLGLQSSILFALRQWAERVPITKVTEMTEKAHAKGVKLTVTHWVALSRIDKAGIRDEFTRNVVNNNWSVSQLRAEIDRAADAAAGSTTRGTGRVPTVPTDVVATLKKIDNKVLAVGNFLSEVKPAQFKSRLAKLEATDALRNQLTSSRDLIVKTIGSMQERLTLIDEKIAAISPTDDGYGGENELVPAESLLDPAELPGSDGKEVETVDSVEEFADPALVEDAAEEIAVEEVITDDSVEEVPADPAFDSEVVEEFDGPIVAGEAPPVASKAKKPPVAVGRKK